MKQDNLTLEALDNIAASMLQRDPVAPLTRDDAYVIWSGKRGRYWAPNERGYAENLGQAGVYSKSEALRIHEQSAYGPEGQRSIMVPLAEVCLDGFHPRPGTVAHLLFLEQQRKG